MSARGIVGRCGVIAVGLAGAALLRASPLWASPCTTDQPEAGVAIRAPLGPAGFGTVPEACAANELSVVGTGEVLIANQDFYGYLHAGVSPRARWVLPSGAWLSVQAPGFDYWFVANATIEAESAGLGPTSLGYHHPLRLGEAVQVAPFARLLLPTESVYEHAWRSGIDHGVSAVWRTSRALEVVGGVTFPALASTYRDTVHVLASSGLAVDVAYRPWTFVTAAGGLGARLQAGDGRAFQALDLRLALRFYPWRGAAVDASLLLPGAGADRRDLSGCVSLGWRWGREE